ncbi:hypothetical protein KC926_01515 [Candidatus Kaiserbacteria bacterium]|nr:hypothetical protein [Candidatus Kaiserbacteria bacterium]
MSKPLKFAFFGGEPLAVPVLEELKLSGLIPELIVCNPDRPTGRKQILTPPPAKVWAKDSEISVFQPHSYKNKDEFSELLSQDWDLFVVVAYNFILPKWILDTPKHGVINVHPSMLPKLRGASPIRTAIRDNLRDDIGVTIMLMDEEMDHGPILDQMHMPISDENWPVSGPELDIALAKMGGALLAEVIPTWVDGEILPQDQEHELATYCHRLSKSDSELNIDPKKLPSGKDAKNIWRTINAFAGIGDTFFTYQDSRVKITQAELTPNKTLRILSVIPEGKKETDFENYLNNLV